MHFLKSILTTTLLVAGAFAAKKTPAERYTDFRSKALSTSPIKLKETSYKTLTSAPRDYSVAVLLTALETRFGCQLCQEFQPEYEILSSSWVKGDTKDESRLLFGQLDFVDGRDIFVSLGLQTAPVLLLFPPTEGPHAVASKDPIRYDFTSGSPTAEQVHNWLSRQLPNRPHPEVRRPINYVRWAAGVTIVLGAITLAATAYPYVLPLIQSRKLWALLCTIGVLVFTSGQMFNSIRGVPYIAGDGKGGISYFHSNFQNQLGLETQIIAALYGLLAICAIQLAHRVPKIAEARQQQVAVVAWGAVLFLFYSFLLSIFRIKNSGYPLSLPPFM